ncbi:helix-turn-helix domain-containing protein [Tsukamurella sp. NPDC003166]|uniref:helix-turn-helix domain-containing protein n=1 Tax=Tsukamurella sp. NPDC003166 TaxID=3154444 RepID=UPI0033A1739E
MNLDELRASRPHDRDNVDRIKSEMRRAEQLHKLRELRESLGITQTVLAERIGVGQARVSNLEKGELSTVKVETVQRYLEALGLDLELVARQPDGTRIPIDITFPRPA